MIDLAQQYMVYIIGWSAKSNKVILVIGPVGQTNYLLNFRPP